ncbi:hypothetical protein B0H19DRAFT_1055670 [Mycena capillaripes]|nr:hypothetical protein B0H19DRAFT_1055670 [Mycena capillaripes]
MTTSGSISRSAFERARSVPNAEPNLAFRFWHFPNLNAERASGSSSVQTSPNVAGGPNDIMIIARGDRSGAVMRDAVKRQLSALDKRRTSPRRDAQRELCKDANGQWMPLI